MQSSVSQRLRGGDAGLRCCTNVTRAASVTALSGFVIGFQKKRSSLPRRFAVQLFTAAAPLRCRGKLRHRLWRVSGNRYSAVR